MSTVAAMDPNGDDGDILAEFDDLLDGDLGGAKMESVDPSLASVDTGSAPALPSTSRTGMATAATRSSAAASHQPRIESSPRVATVEEVEAAFNFDPDAALAESRDHFDRLFAAAVSQRRSATGPQYSLASPSIPTASASSESRSLTAAPADGDHDEDGETRAIRGYAARAASALGYAYQERRRAREQIRSGSRASERAEFDRAIAGAGSVWEVERLLKRRQEAQRLEREAAFERVRAAVATADDDAEVVAGLAAAAGGGDDAIGSAVLATTLRRAAEIRATTARELQEAAGGGEGVIAVPSGPGNTGRADTAAGGEFKAEGPAGGGGGSAADPAAPLGQAWDDPTAPKGITATDGATAPRGITGISRMQAVLAGVGEAASARGRGRGGERGPKSSESDLLAAETGTGTDPTDLGLSAALDYADRRVIADTEASAELVHGAVLRQIQSAFGAEGGEEVRIEGSPDGGLGPEGAGDAPSAGGDGGVDESGIGGGLVGFLDDRQGEALDRLLDELGVPSPGEGGSGGGSGSAEGAARAGAEGGGASSELSAVLALLDKEASSSRGRRGGRGRRERGTGPGSSRTIKGKYP